MSSDLQIFQWLYGEFDTVLTTYIGEKAAAMISAIGPTAWTMFGIYVIFWGFSMIRGLIDEPVTDGLFRLLKVATVMGFALNLGLYQSYVVEFFMQTPDAMADVLGLGARSESGGVSTFATIDKIVNQTIDTAEMLYNQMSALSPGQSIGLAISANFVLAFGLFFALAAAIMIILAKMMLVILLALGPLFIVMAMFKTTQRFFEAWLGQLVTAVMTIVLLLSVCALLFGLVEMAIGGSSEVSTTSPLQAVAYVVTICGAATWALFKVEGAATAYGGSIALQIGEAGKRFSGASTVNSVASAAQNTMARKVVGAAAAKATGGASIAASTAGQLFRASNTISRA